jgi:thioredoxin-like negative regulator of GroEL
MPSHLMPRHLRAALCGAALLAVSAAAIPAQTPTQGDLTALRYYWEQENETAVRSETRRLMLEFPDWTPPEDLGQLFATTGPGQVDEIYRLIEVGEFDAARALIAEIDARNTGWTPPPEMMEYLNLSQAQAEFDAAERTGDVATLVTIVRGVPSLLSCERVNNAWLLAEAHLALGNTTQALSVYSAVTRTCTAPETLIATLEKAAAIAPTATLAELSDTAQAQAPDAAPRIRATEDRLRAGRGEEPRWMDDEQVIALEIDAAGAPAAPPAPPANAQPDTVQAGASGPTVVATAPRATGTSGGGGAATGGGGAVSAVQAAAERGAWAQCLSLSQGSRNLDVLFQRGWCAYNADRAMEAVSAFDEAARRAGSSEMRRDASYGLLLSMLRLNMTEQAAQIAAAAPLTRTQRIEVEGQILDQRGVRAYESGDYGRAAAFFAAHAQLTGTTRRDLALLHGYALLNSGDRAGARAIFERLHRQMATPETRQALRAAR